MPRRRLPFPLSARHRPDRWAAAWPRPPCCSSRSAISNTTRCALGFEQRAGIRDRRHPPGPGRGGRSGDGDQPAVRHRRRRSRASSSTISPRRCCSATRFIKAFNFHRQVGDAERAALRSRRCSRCVPGSVRRPSWPTAGRCRRAAPRQLQRGRLPRTAGRQRGRVRHRRRPPAPQIDATLARAVDSGQASATSLLGLAQDAAPAGRLPGDHAGVPPRTPPLGSAGRAARRADRRHRRHHPRRRPGAENPRPATTCWPTTACAWRCTPSGADGQPLPVFHSAGAAPRGAAAARAGRRSLAPGSASGWRSTSSPAWCSSLDVAGQPWRIEVGAAPRPFLADHLGSLLVLVGGALLTLLMSALVQAMAQRSRRVAAAGARTHRRPRSCRTSA